MGQRVETEKAFGDCFTAHVLIDGNKTCCLLDTDSEVTTILHCFLAEMRKEEQHFGQDGKIGYVKVVGRQAVVIPPVKQLLKVAVGFILKMKIQASSSTNTPSGLLVSNVLPHLLGGKVPVRQMNSIDLCKQHVLPR